MRTLTLGLLIVCFGTLAALPFRKYQVIPDASSDPSHVTGPTQSPLSSSVTADSAPKTEQLPSLADPGTFLPTTVAGQTPNRRHIDIPLTYDDLAVPLDQPKPVLDRFSAVASVHQQKLEQERVSSLVMPALESLPLAQQPDFVRHSDSVVSSIEQPQRRAAGRLASAMPPEPANDEVQSTPLGSLPSADDEAHSQRYWIRQPN